MSASRLLHVCDPIDSVLLEVGVLALNWGEMETPLRDFVEDCLEREARPVVVPAGEPVPVCLRLEVASAELRGQGRPKSGR